MIFLIEYNRNLGQIITFKSFNGVDRKGAEDERFEIELALNRTGIKHEVILLEAATEAALRRTHRRYFEDLKQLVAAP